MGHEVSRFVENVGTGFTGCPSHHKEHFQYTTTAVVANNSTTTTTKVTSPNDIKPRHLAKPDDLPPCPDTDHDLKETTVQTVDMQGEQQFHGQAMIYVCTKCGNHFFQPPA